MNDKIPIYIFCAVSIFMGVTGLFVAIPKEGWEVVQRMSLVFIICFGIMGIIITRKKQF